ncbi:FAD-dependent oxidoreductase [Micromonospora marina]|uniref:FAD-dependent oxidoreductase n=1 Tax=Micromonospora marina TaxID=307120 RepID=UPI00345504F4
MNPLPNRKDFDEHTFDLVVVGGGLAGLCAAIAAARGGTRTAIVQDRPMFGGNSSSEVRVVPHGSSHGAAWGAETGVVHELILADRATNHESFFDHGLINSLYDLTLFEAARQEPLLTTFMNTSVRGVLVDDLGDGSDGTYTRRITAVHGSQLGSEKELLLRARQFVDASGDGTVGFLAGAEYRYGRESRATFGEPLAPAEADDTTLGSTITMRAKKIDRPAPYTPPPWIARYTTPDDFVMDRRLYHIEKEQFGGYWWLEVNNPFHQIDDYEAIRDELHRHVLGVWNYLKNHSPEKERFTDYVLEWIGQIPGKRESRRFVGDVTVTEHDCHVDRRWPDGVAYASWWIDLHIKGGINNREAPGERENIDRRYSDYIRVVPFSLPLRAFYSRNVENLWFAGRVYSVSHIALGPVRVQQSLAAAGQAVGLAAAHALRHGVTPRRLADPGGPYIQPLRQDLLRHDARLLGVRNTDPSDLACSATVTASSSVPLTLPDPTGLPETKHRWQPLDRDRAQVVPVTTDRINEISVYVRNTGELTAEVVVGLEELQRIWDREHGKPVASTVVSVPAGHEGWVSAVLDSTVTPDRPHRVILRADGDVTAGVSWATATPMPVGTVAQYLCVSPGGPEEKNADLECLSPAEVELPAYELWRQFRKGAHGLRITPQQRPYEPRYAVNGAAWPEDLPNLWASEPIGEDPQWLRLDWDAPVTFASVQVSFDTDLDAGCDKRPGFYRAPQCVRDWRVRALVDGQWTTLHAETGNVQRHRVVRLPEPVTASAVRIDVYAVNDESGTFGARIFEVRVHAH